MIIEEPLNAEDANETKWAGVGVILICWVPGIVAILHLIASHKYTYICLSYKSILCSLYALKHLKGTSHKFAMLTNQSGTSFSSLVNRSARRSERFVPMVTREQISLPTKARNSLQDKLTRKQKVLE